MTNQEQYELICKKSKKYDRLVGVLDKIRAEIEALNPVNYVYMSSYDGHRGASDMKDDVLQIIDKYKSESEDKE